MKPLATLAALLTLSACCVPSSDTVITPAGGGDGPAFEHTVSRVSPEPYTPGDDGKPADAPSSKGNASANNGKGGNYDKTGHNDNGKGKGRDKK